jgi:hypothetical protein
MLRKLNTCGPSEGYALVRMCLHGWLEYISDKPYYSNSISPTREEATPALPRAPSPSPFGWYVRYRQCLYPERHVYVFDCSSEG